MHTAHEETAWDTYNRVRGSVAYLLRTRMDPRPQLYPEAVADDLLAEIFDLCFDRYYPSHPDLWSHRALKPEGHEAHPIREPEERPAHRRKLSDPEWTPADLLRHGWARLLAGGLVLGLFGAAFR